MALVHQKTFARAAGIMGGTCELASRLHVQPTDVEAWIAGEEPPPSAFLAAADIVFNEVMETLHRAAADTSAPTPATTEQAPEDQQVRAIESSACGRPPG